MKRALRLTVSIALAALVVWLLARSLGGLGPVLASLGTLSAGGVVVALVLSSVCVALGVARWQAMVALFGHSLPFGRALRATLAVWPLVLVAPSRSNELLRAVAVRDLVPASVGAASVITEKVIDLGVLLVVAAAGVAFYGLWTWALVLAAGAGVVAAVVWTLSLADGVGPRWPARLRPHLEAILTGLRALRTDGLGAARVIGLSLLIRALTVVIILGLLQAGGARVDLVAAALLAPAAMFAGLLPFTLTGIGVRDAAFLHLLTAAGAAPGDPAPILAATLAYSGIATWSFAVVGLPLMAKEGLRTAAAFRAGSSTAAVSVAPATPGDGSPAARDRAG